MGAFLRSISAIIVGVIVAMVLFTLFELVGTLIFPLPPGVDPNDAQALQAAAGQMHAGAYVLALLGWAVGSFVGAWLAGRMAGRTPLAHGMIVAVLLLIGGVANMLAISHPIWVWVLGIAAFLGCGYAGARQTATPKPVS